MTTDTPAPAPSAKQQFLQAQQTKRDIDQWIAKPRCANCDRYNPAGSHCAAFGLVPVEAAFVIHASPCPQYQFDSIPF